MNIDNIMDLSEKSRNALNDVAHLCSGEVENHIFDMGFYNGYLKNSEKYKLRNIIDLYIEETGYGMDMWGKEENEVMTTIGKIIQSLEQPKID